MTAPRLTLPNSYYFISRRTTQRQFLLVPDEPFSNAVRYCMALAANKHDIHLIWSAWMSNHYHLGIFDPYGNVSKFLAELNRNVSKHHNCRLGRFENLFDNSKASIVRVETLDDLLDKMAYSLANPSAADLVERAADWPGELSLPSQLLHAQRIERPADYFRGSGKCPSSIELEYRKPPCAAHMSDDEYRAEVGRRVAWLEKSHRARRDLKMKTKHASRERNRVPSRVVGASRVLGQQPTDTPTSFAKRFGLSPRIAARKLWIRIRAVERLKTFYADYRAAREAWCAGNRDVVFPAGTYWMRVHHGCRCADPPDGSFGRLRAA